MIANASLGKFHSVAIDYYFERFNTFCISFSFFLFIFFFSSITWLSSYYDSIRFPFNEDQVFLWSIKNYFHFFIYVFDLYVFISSSFTSVVVFFIFYFIYILPQLISSTEQLIKILKCSHDFFSISFIRGEEKISFFISIKFSSSFHLFLMWERKWASY